MYIYSLFNDNYKNNLISYKHIKFCYKANQDISKILEDFKRMINFYIKKGLKKNITSKFRLQDYKEFKRKFGYHTHYCLSACEIATSILKNYRRKLRRGLKTKKPFVKKAFLKLDNQTFKIDNDTIRIPTKPKEFIYLSLEIGKYQKYFLKSKFKKFQSLLSFDVNEKSLDCIISKKKKLIYTKYSLSEVKRIHYVYFKKRKNIREKMTNKPRLMKQKLKKYKGKEKRRIEIILHKISKEIARYAEAVSAKIIMEDLTNIRNSIKFNKQRNRRLHTWNFKKLQRFIEYKCLWNGNQVIYINPKNTSKICSICGCKGKLKEHIFECKCGLKINRHLNACVNILKTQDGGKWFYPDGELMKPLLVNEALQVANVIKGEHSKGGEL